MRTRLYVYFAFLLFLCSNVNAQTFDFDDGTKQGWSLLGPYDDLGNGPYSSNFTTLQWVDHTNYPSPIRKDVTGDYKGSVSFGLNGNNGILNSPGTYWIMNMLSPDLTESGDWQVSNGFTINLTHNMGLQTAGPVWVQLGVTVLDVDSNKTHKYKTAAPEYIYSTVWDTLQFKWSDIQNLPSNYLIKGVSVIVWGRLSDYYFGDIYLDNVKPLISSRIKVISPNGGEIWKANSIQTIRWHSIEVKDVKIELSTNGGQVWQILNPLVPASAESYSFSVPNISSLSCLVKISDAAVARYYDLSDNYFSITYSESISISNPNINSVWQLGQSNFIKWTDNISDNVKIELFKAGTLVKIISTSTESDGYYLWVIPTNLTPAKDYRIKISSIKNTSTYDFSDYFQIEEAPYIHVTSPESNTTWQMLTSQNILWEDNITEGVKIDLFKDGAFLLNISESTESDGSYTFNVPQDLAVGSDYQVRIISTVNPQVEAFSNRFTIALGGYITIISPNSTSVWYLGNNEIISWNDNFDDPVKIELYKSRVYLGDIVNPTESDGSYTFEVPASLSSGTDYQIKIISTANSAILAFSEIYTISVPPPIANFEGEPRLGVDTLTVSFRDLSSGDVNTWYWDFGDGGSSEEKNPVHFYQSVGSYTVSLTVWGPGGEDNFTQTNYINVSALTVNAPNEILEGSTAVVEVSIPPEINPTDRKIYYRQGGENSFTSLDLIPAGNFYRGEIPSTEATIRGIEYYILISDRQVTFTYPAGSPQLNPAIIRVRVQDMVIPVGLQDMKYQMISFPFELTNPNIEDNLSDDLGDYDINNWRLFNYDPGISDYLEYPSIGTGLIQSRAYWIITRNATALDISSGLSTLSSGPFAVTLLPGWNQIANPFAFPISWSFVGNSSVLNQLPVIWNSNSLLYEPDQTILNPWQGYFIYNDYANGMIDLYFPPAESVIMPKPNFIPALFSEGEFIIKLSAEGIYTGMRDNNNFAGMLRTASNDLGLEDYLEPPAVKEQISLNIIDEDKNYGRNIIAVSSDGAFWELELRSPVDEKIRLDLDLISPLPYGFKVFIIDQNSEIILSESATQTEISISAGGTKIMKLIVGTDEYTSDQIKNYQPIPDKFELYQNYPNPFNPSTIIRYKLKSDSKVSLIIYDVLGREIATLVDGEQNAGIYQVQFSTLNYSLSSGVFFYKLQTDEFTAIKKMVLVK